MRYQKQIVITSSTLLLLLSCGIPPTMVLEPIEALAPGVAASPNISETIPESSGISQYLMNLSNSFTIQSIKEEHDTQVSDMVKKFQSDLEKGDMTDYYQTPGFSIKLLAGSEGNFLTGTSDNNQLLAGSEGNFFNTNVDLSESVSTEASFAQALVIYSDQTSAVYKGQLVDQTFYFAGDEELKGDNTTYLVTLDTDLQSQVIQGELINNVAFEVAPSAESIPELTPTPTSTPEPTVETIPSMTSPPCPGPFAPPPPVPPVPPENCELPPPPRFPPPGGVHPPGPNPPHLGLSDPFERDPFNSRSERMFFQFDERGRLRRTPRPENPPPNVFRQRYSKALKSFQERGKPHSDKVRQFKLSPPKRLPPFHQIFEGEYRREYTPFIDRLISSHEELSYLNSLTREEQWVKVQELKKTRSELFQVIEPNRQTLPNREKPKR